MANARAVTPGAVGAAAAKGNANNKNSKMNKGAFDRKGSDDDFIVSE